MKTNRKVFFLIPVIFISGFMVTGFIGSESVDFTCKMSESTCSRENRDPERNGQENLKYRYVGAEKCAKTCHNNEEMGFQYDIVRNSRIAGSFKVLDSRKADRIARKAGLKEDPQKSIVCLCCHVTGGGLDTSFFAVTYKKEDGITCEACHKGPYRPKSFIPVESDCLKCHNNSVHGIPEFIFIERSEKIAHRRPETKKVKSQV